MDLQRSSSTSCTCKEDVRLHQDQQDTLPPRCCVPPGSLYSRRMCLSRAWQRIKLPGAGGPWQAPLGWEDRASCLCWTCMAQRAWDCCLHHRNSGLSQRTTLALEWVSISWLWTTSGCSKNVSSHAQLWKPSSSYMAGSPISLKMQLDVFINEIIPLGCSWG